MVGVGGGRSARSPGVQTWTVVTVRLTAEGGTVSTLEINPPELQPPSGERIST
jgi:hypothetical protein